MFMTEFLIDVLFFVRCYGSVDSAGCLDCHIQIKRGECTLKIRAWLFVEQEKESYMLIDV